MYLAELNIWNFRKYGTRINDTGDILPGLSVKFNQRLNVFVGENDSGKTAIIDAIKLTLNTHSSDYIRPETDDFHLTHGESENNRASEFKIECIFRNLAPDEAKNFLEWLSFDKDNDGNTIYFLKLFLVATRKQNGVYYDVKAGNVDEGTQMDGKARDLLKVTYLKPLRDADRELSSRKNSRLSQVLYNHETFKNKDSHKLIDIIEEANNLVANYFKGIDDTGSPLDDQDGKNLLKDINDYLKKFSRQDQNLKSYFALADVKLKAILEKLNLYLSNNKIGLGSQNLLFIATELLLLKSLEYTGLRLALIEEIEAHLHPQAQLRLIEYLQEECNTLKMQVFLTTHSPSLASKVNLEGLLLCKNSFVFNMSHEHTLLRKGDYLFLERFLDSTKANLFFANGVILVEGDAENILFPIIAKLIDIPLSKYGVSIVNVGSTAFLRYSNIFARKEASLLMGIPVSCVTDLDVKPPISNSEYKVEGNIVDFDTSKAYNKNRKKELYTKQEINCFISDDWTLEYCIALSSFQTEFFKAVLYSKYVQNSEQYGLTDKKKEAADKVVSDKIGEWDKTNTSNEERAYYIYNDIMLKTGDKVSKAITAQYFSMILIELGKEEVKQRFMSDPNLVYIKNAIEYAAGLEA